LQRVEFAFARGNGDFLLTQFRLRGLQARLQFRLLAQQRTAFAARLGDAILNFRQFILQFGDLIFTAKNRAGRFGTSEAVQITARVNSVTAQQISSQRDKIAARVAILDLRRRRRQIRRDECAAKQRAQKFVHGRIGLNHVKRADDLTLLQTVCRRSLIFIRRQFAAENKLLVVGN